MLGHLGVNVPDLAAAKNYYDEFMPLVGFEPFIASADEFAFRPAGRQTWHLRVFLSVHRTRRSLATPYRAATSRFYGQDAVRRRARPSVRTADRRRGAAHTTVVPAISAALLRHVLAGPVRHHAGSGVPPRCGVIGSAYERAPNQLGAVAITTYRTIWSSAGLAHRKELERRRTTGDQDTGMPSLFLVDTLSAEHPL